MTTGQRPWRGCEITQRAFDAQRALDPPGLRRHLVLALLWCVLLASPTSVVEFAGAPLMLAAIIRLGVSWRTYVPLFRQPLAIAVGATVLWTACGLLWTPDRDRGIDEFGVWRWLFVAIALWPVMEHRRTLIAALKVGFLLGNLVQLGHFIGVRFGVTWLSWDRDPSRISGWWDPVVGGTLLVGALGLHLPAAFRGRGRERIIGIVGVCITLAAIAATGTRGAMIASVLVGAGALGAFVVSALRSKQSVTPALVALGASVAVMTLAAVVLREPIGSRLDRARSEIRAALEDGNYATDTGARLAMASVAIQEFRARPLTGVGTGGFGTWAHERAETVSGGSLAHDHAHNALLHAAATLGFPGALLLIASVFMAIRNGLMLRCTPTSERRASDDGPAWALIALACVSLFDSVQVNAQTAALMITLMLMWRPRPSSLHWSGFHTVKLLIVSEYIRRLPWSSSAWAVTVARAAMMRGAQVTIACDGIESAAGLDGVELRVRRPRRTLRSSAPLAFQRWAEAMIDAGEHDGAISLTRFVSAPVWVPLDPGSRDMIRGVWAQFGPLSAAMEIASRPWLPMGSLASRRARAHGEGCMRARPALIGTDGQVVGLGYVSAAERLADDRAAIVRRRVRERYGIKPEASAMLVSVTEAGRPGLREFFDGVAGLEVLRAVPDPVVMVIGRRARWVASVAKTAGIGERVRFLGATSDIASVMACADAAVAPWDDTRRSSTARFVADALKCGVPVALTARTAGQELVQPAHFGTFTLGAVVERSSASSWSAALSELLQPPQLEAAKRATAMIEHTLSMERFGQTVIELCRSYR